MQIATLSRYYLLFSGVLVLVAGWSVYFHTLDVPFYLDDIASIVDNPAIQTLDNTGALWSFSGLRIFTYYTFALNYSIHGVDVAGYHIVNIAIHLLMGIVILVFVDRLQMLAEKNSSASGFVRLSKFLPLVVALIFVVHPLNIQSVTYVVQRLSSLSALLYLGSMLLYLSARLSTSVYLRISFFIGAMGVGGLALLTKQNAFTLPFAFLLIEFCFFYEYWQQRKKVLGAIILVGIAMLALIIIGIFLFDLIDAEWLVRGLRETKGVTRLEYFSAQMLVIWKYIMLLFWPHPLNLDYNQNIIENTFNVKMLVAMMGHIALIGYAFIVVKIRPLIAFGILFYYLALSIESSFIPIRDLMFEHRTYLPNVGMILAISAAFFSIKPLGFKLKISVVTVLILILSVMTWQRNDLWRDQIAFYDAAIKNAPDQPRNWIALSQVYFKHHQDAKALDLLRKELRQNKINNNGVLKEPNYVLAFWSQLLRANGMESKADKVETVYGLKSDNRTQQRLLLEKGNSELVKGELAKATKFYNEVLKINSNHENAQVNIGVIALMEGRLDQAEEIFVKFPGNSIAKSNLKVISGIRKGTTRIENVERKVVEKSQ